ncbi:MAG: BON domain-containing protein [Blastocatellia bacterium]
MSEYRERRTVVEDVPIGRRPVVEEQYDTVVHERRGMSGAAIAAIVIAAIAAAVLITMMIVNSNQQGREDELARQRDKAEADARAAQAANQHQPVPQPMPSQSQPSTVVVPVPVPVPSASQPAPAASEPAVSDTSIEIEINSKMLDDGDLRSHPIDVKFSGGIVRLSGTLPNEDLKMRAEQVARTVKGVRRVVNNITVSAQ